MDLTVPFSLWDFFLELGVLKRVKTVSCAGAQVGLNLVILSGLGCRRTQVVPLRRIISFYCLSANLVCVYCQDCCWCLLFSRRNQCYQSRWTAILLTNNAYDLPACQPMECDNIIRMLHFHDNSICYCILSDHELFQPGSYKDSCQCFCWASSMIPWTAILLMSYTRHYLCWHCMVPFRSMHCVH